MKLKSGRNLLAGILIIFFLLVSGVENAQAIQMGGKIKLQSGLFYQQDIRANFSGLGELEFFLPETSNLNARLVLRAKLDDYSPEVGIKYFYLRRQLENGHITLGRQPVSWSYGAIINPLDFGFGVQGLAGEVTSSEIDGVRYFHSLGNGASLQLVTGFSEGLEGQSLDRMGYGARLRVPQAGHDFSINLIDQPLELGPVQLGDNLSRLGLTYSGDAGSLGLYGAIGYYRLRSLELDDIVGQVGIDYSWQVGPEYEQKTVYFQGEYLRFFKKELGPIFFMQIGGGNNLVSSGSPAVAITPELYDLIVGNLSMEIDPFSQVGSALITETGEWLFVLIPYYQTDLGGGVELRVEGSFLREPGGGSSGGGNVVLSYYF